MRNTTTRWQRIGIGAAIGLACLASWQGSGRSAEADAAAPEAARRGATPAEEESCIRCHRDPEFLVTHPKLYEYFQDWQRSIHRQEGVTCSDCHGGRPEAEGREAAHATMLGESSPESAVNFANIPSTCGSCHGYVEEAYRKSTHFERLTRHEDAADGAEGAQRRGPSCVTCHDSMNTLTLDVTTVEATCARCHDEENHPEIPDEARAALNKFLSIDRFHRYVAVRLDPSESREFLADIDRRREALSVLWHTFDLERIDAATIEILDDLRHKRDEIRRSARSASPPAGEGGGGPPAR